MIFNLNFKKENFSTKVNFLKEAWQNPENKVFVLSPDEIVTDPRAYYESIFPLLGSPFALAEDVNLGSRDNQRSGNVWMEVRYDPNHPDAYRHSQNSQPLHTDGSYISNFPSSTILVCQANAADGGETTFLDSLDLYRVLKTERSDLLNFFLRKKILHKRSGDQRNDYLINVVSDKIIVNYNYYCLHRNVNDSLNKKFEDFQDFLIANKLIKKHTTGVKLKPGEAVFWKDDECLHGRNSFNPTKTSERFIWKCAIDIFK